MSSDYTRQPACVLQGSRWEFEPVCLPLPSFSNPQLQLYKSQQSQRNLSMRWWVQKADCGVMPLAAISCLSLAAKYEEVGMPGDIRALQVASSPIASHTSSLSTRTLDITLVRGGLQVFLLSLSIPSHEHDQCLGVALSCLLGLKTQLCLEMHVPHSGGACCRHKLHGLVCPLHKI